MSPRARIITLNLGSQSIELAEFRAQPQGRLILCGYRSRELLADSAREGTRWVDVVAAIREMMGELHIKSGSVNYTVAEESIFTRFVKLPAIDDEKIERIISFEAQQNVPFPIDEVNLNKFLQHGALKPRQNSNKLYSGVSRNTIGFHAHKTNSVETGGSQYRPLGVVDGTWYRSDA